MARTASQDIKVGVFVVVLLLAMMLTLFFLGGSTEILEQRYMLNGSWKDVGGLQAGAAVRLAGWNVGEVSAIRFSDDLAVKEVFIEMKVMKKYQPRIRKDSEARIDTQGVLGDKYISITMGSPDVPQLEDGDWIPTADPLNILDYTKKATELLASTASITHKVDLMLGADKEASAASVAKSLTHIESILAEAKEGNGLLHALVYDEAMTRKVQGTLTNLEQASAGLNSVATEIRSGEGLAHTLIYGDEGVALAKQLGDLAQALDGITRDIKSDDSLVHALIYDPEKAKMLDDLAVTAANLRVTSEAISSGEGTIGLLARDPALYEDLRSLVGGAERNKLLRAYIRATVRKGEEKDAAPGQPRE